MLVSLTIENFAIIDKVHLDFNMGMSVLSGETGAGKSIIIDALGILCGGRGSSDFIRQGQDKLTIEGLFRLKSYPDSFVEIIDNYGLSVNLAEDDLIIRREINQTGKNLIRINGQLANVSLLKELGKYLVDIHGQSEHQALLNKQEHINLLDQFAGDSIQNEVTKYQAYYRQYYKLEKEFQKAEKDDSHQEQRIDFLEFQINEIEEHHLVEGEYEELQAISKKLQNAQELTKAYQEINYLVSESETSLINRWQEVVHLIESIQPLDSRLSGFLTRLKAMNYEIEDIGQELSLLEVTNEENQSLDEIEGRLGQLSHLKRKYKMEIPEIIQYYQDISEEVYQMKHRERYLEDLVKKLEAAYLQVLEQGQILSQIRQETAKALEEAIEAELADLYMGHSRFIVDIQEVPLVARFLLDKPIDMYQLNESGMNQIEFYVMTNLGESVKPLVQVASGGELSRYMLALKSVFCRNDQGKTMVFDEIDTGVSGRVAKAIAEKIKAIGIHHQVLCITHLPQVAAIADYQIYIRKIVSEGRTYSQAQYISTLERMEHISMMISGRDITKASLGIAKEMLAEYDHEI